MAFQDKGKNILATREAHFLASYKALKVTKQSPEDAVPPAYAPPTERLGGLRLNSFERSQQASHPSDTRESGSYENISWVIKHRNTDSATVTITLGPGDVIRARSGSMVHMSSSVSVDGKINVSWKTILSGSQMVQGVYTGPGVASFAPTLMGDILPLIIEPGSSWKMTRDAFLASTSGVEKEMRAHGFPKMALSGDGLFVFDVLGSGVVWLTSFGAIEEYILQDGEEHIVEHGHLVAWNIDYQAQAASSNGIWSSIKSGEGVVCRFVGPGTIYIQTRNVFNFEQFIKDTAKVRGEHLHGGGQQ